MLQSVFLAIINDAYAEVKAVMTLQRHFTLANFFSSVNLVLSPFRSQKRSPCKY